MALNWLTSLRNSTIFPKVSGDKQSSSHIEGLLRVVTFISTVPFIFFTPQSLLRTGRLVMDRNQVSVKMPSIMVNSMFGTSLYK